MNATLQTTGAEAKPAPAANIITLQHPAALPHDIFKFKGKTYRIYKRSNGRDDPWQLCFERNHRRFRQSLGTNEKEAAIAKAKLLLEAAEQGELDSMRRLVSSRAEVTEASKVADIIAKFEALPLDISEAHRHNCVNCFKLVLSKVHGAGVEDLPATVLNAETGRRYFELALLKAKAERDQEAQARVKRSANSIFNQAQCLLRPKVLAAYRRAGLVLPDVEPFLQSFDQERFEGVTAVYDPPAESLIRKTLHEWLKLTDRNMFLAVGLELACGLRKGEVAQVCWGMWSRNQGAPLLDGRGWVKNATGRFVVPPIDPFWRLLNRRIQAEGWRGREDELVLDGTQTDLADCIFRNVGAWLRGLGWQTQKTNHALRAYAGSLVAMKYDIYRASAWLRHRSVKTTEAHYTHFLSGRVFKPELVRIRWAH